MHRIISMKRFLSTLSVFLFLLFTTHPGSCEVMFIDDLGDVPLMDGIEIIEGTGYIFEQENGRLVERIAASNLDKKDIEKYYALSLQALGWEKNNNTYKRANETLKITFKKEGSLTLVIFKLSPQ